MDERSPEQIQDLLQYWDALKPDTPDIIAICKCGCNHKIYKRDTRPDLAALSTSYTMGIVYENNHTAHTRKCLQENFK